MPPLKKNRSVVDPRLTISISMHSKDNNNRKNPQKNKLYYRFTPKFKTHIARWAFVAQIQSEHFANSHFSEMNRKNKKSVKTEKQAKNLEGCTPPVRDSPTSPPIPLDRSNSSTREKGSPVLTILFFRCFFAPFLTSVKFSLRKYNI